METYPNIQSNDELRYTLFQNHRSFPESERCCAPLSLHLPDNHSEGFDSSWFPTTYIYSDSLDETGIVEGIKNGHTFVARTPVSAQVLMTIELNERTYMMGDEIPISTEGEAITVRVQVGRANGGKLRLRYGPRVESDQALDTSLLGTNVIEQLIDSDDYVAEWNQHVYPGDWFFPIVLEPLIGPETTEEQATAMQELATAVSQTGEEDFLGLATLFTTIVENEVLFDGSECDIKDWAPDKLQCLPVDDEDFGSFFVPDMIDRALNVYVENGAITEWSMGAIGSAILFVD